MKTHQKWAIAASAAMVGSGVSAQSRVSIYGLLDSGVRYVSSNGTVGRLDLSDGAFLASRLGFQGTEDLGGGMSALFVLETGVDPTKGTLTPPGNATAGYGQAAAAGGRAFGRQSYVGLAGNFGTVTLGRQYTTAHLLSARFEPQTNPNSAALSVLPQWQIARWDNMVKYSYTAGPLNGTVGYAFNEQTNGKASTAAGSYTSGPVDLVGYYERMDSNGTGADTRKVTGLGGNYLAWPGLKTFLGYMQRSQTASAAENHVWTGGLLYDLTQLLQLTLSLTADHQTSYVGSSKGNRKVGYVAAEYRLSKRTSVYVEMDRNLVEGGYALPSFMAHKGAQNGAMMGVQHRF